MIIDSRHVDDAAEFFVDVCIVGAGAAGITLAHALVKSGLTVVLAEAGDVAPATDGSAFDGEVMTPRHPPLDLYRSRCFGGTTALWGGRCAPLDPLDFEVRPWVPFSGWPIGWSDLEPAYRRASAYCDLGAFAWDVASGLPHRPPEMIPGFRDHIVLSETIDRFGPPVRFGERYRPDLTRSRKIRVLLNATAIRLCLDPAGTRLERVLFASDAGRRFTVAARITVLAAGGLETTRLLLVSDDVCPAGVGNGHGLVGRFYMCHLQGKSATLCLRRDLRGVVYHYERDSEGVYCRRKLRIAAADQRARGLMNFVARLEHPAIPDARHGNGILSAMYLSRHLLKPEYARKLAETGLNGGTAPPRRADLLRHMWNVLADGPAVLRFAASWVPKRRFAKRRPPYVALPGKDNVFHLDYYAEQAPNPDSRVVLSDRTDCFGCRRLRVDWRTMARDHDSVVESFRLIQSRLGAAGVGKLDYDEDYVRTQFSAIGGHHMGTARMADHPSRGVVDSSGKVFGVDNLFIASSAIFPTCGYASPTLTLVALALRLADHLKERLAA